MTDQQWQDLTLGKAIKEIKAGHLHAKDILTESISRVLKDQKRSDTLNAVISLHEEKALKQIEALGSTINETKFAGLPILAKSNMHFTDYPVDSCSKILEGYISPYTGGMGQKLLENGASIFGMSNMDEFAMGSSNETSVHGLVRNPINREYTPGGSSGGSAAAVGGGLCLASLGSDTGGSIRQPATCCGAVGLKPTYGRISRYGLIAFSSSFDQIGPITRNCEDAALLLDGISGFDENDSTSLNLPPTNTFENLENSLKGKRIALPDQFFGEGVDSEILAEMDKIIDFFKKAGVTFDKVSLDHTEYGIAIYYVLSSAESSTNLARFDGVRYGRRSPQATTLDQIYEQSRSQGFGREVKRRILTGGYVLSSGYYDDYYMQAQRLRNCVQKEYLEVFEKFDMILTPTMPYKVFKIGERIDDPIAMYLSDAFTVAANVTGLPALSVPCASDSRGLPISFQLLARPCAEDIILNAGHLYERENKKNK